MTNSEILRTRMKVSDGRIVLPDRPGVGVVPRIVVDNSPLKNKVRILPVEPRLRPYDVGLFALDKKLRNPLIEAFWAQIR